MLNANHDEEDCILSFAIAVDLYVRFKSYGEFKDIQSFIFSYLKKVR